MTTAERKLLDSGLAAGAATTCNTTRPIACVLEPPPSADAVVTIQNYDGTALGAIQGKAQRNSWAWRGIPYAAAPTGSLRLAPPAKVTSWTGTRRRSTTAPRARNRHSFHSAA